MRRASLALVLSLFAASPAMAQNAGAGGASAPARVGSRATRALRMGDATLRAGDRGSAIGWFRQAIQSNPSDPRGYARLGEAYRSRGSLADARQVLEAGLVRSAGSPELWMALAHTLVDGGSLEDAAAALRSLLARTPDHAEGLRLRAELARRRGAWSEALTATRAILARREALGLDEEAVHEARRFEAALRLLARPLDPVSAARACEGTPLRRALARCR